MGTLRSIYWTLAVVVSGANAQEVVPDFYKGPGIDPNRSYVNQSFNERIDPFNGSVQLHYIDISLPGNGGFDIQVARSYNSASVNESNPGAFFGSAGVGWSVHFGRVIYRPSVGPCGGASSSDVLKAPVFELPDGSTQILAASSIPGAVLTSTQRWRAECVGSGMVVYSPDGVRYDMTQAVSVPNGTASPSGALYATKITDRNGNYATVSYSQSGSPEVISVTAGPNDNRRIDFTYVSAASGESSNARRISTITSSDSTGNRTFSYGYTALAGSFRGFQLTSVVRPDGLQWQYRYVGNLNAAVPGGFQLNGLTYPDGGAITYSYGSSSSDYVYFDSISNALSRSTVVKSKTTSDGGNWTFSYSPGSAGVYDVTTVNTPSGSVVYRHVGPNFASSGSLWMVGLLMQKQVGGVQTEVYNWTPQVVSTQQFKRPGAWVSTRFDSTMNAALLASKTVTRDGVNHTSTFSNFDAYGNPRTVVEAGPNGGSRTTTLTYFQNTSLWILKQLKNESVAGGVQVTRNFDATGNLLDVTRDGVSTAHSYFADGSISRTTFPRGLVHNYANYMRGIPQTESQPEGITIRRTVSDAGNVLSETNGNGFKTSFAYDPLNRVNRIAPPQGNVTNIAYGQASKSAVRGALVESTVYDGFGRPTSVTLGGVMRAYRYDPLGRLTFISNPGASGVGTNYQYDMLDRVVYVGNADGTSRTISFGPASKTIRDERGYFTSYYYRAYGDPGQQQLMSITAPEAATSVTLERNSRDLVTKITQGGLSRSYGFDGRGYLTSVSNPETGITVYGRDDAGNMVSRSVGASGIAAFGYDGQNRLTSATYPGNTPSVVKTYTGTSKLSTVTTSVGSRAYGYDTNDNLTTESLTIDGVNFGLAYGYNGNDQLSALTYPRSGRVVSYGPDQLGRPTVVSGFVGGISYWPSGQVSQITYANGTTSTYDQNSRLWPASFQASKGTAAYLSSAYTYDGSGNLTTVSDSVDNSFNRALGYDGVNRLTSASGPWGTGQLTYDGAGNLRSQVFGGNALNYTYDPTTNRLSNVNGARTAAYSYDAFGSIANAGGKTFNYDGAPNMTCANCSEATPMLYQYDGLNQRVSAIKGGLKTYEFYDAAGHLLVELTPGLSNRLTEYIYLGGKRIATVGPAPTTITLPAQSLTAVAGRSVTLIATIGGSASATGSVSFFDGQTLLATTTVAGGKASLTTTFQAVGAHILSATYSGDGTNAGSSTMATLTVVGAGTISGPAGGVPIKAVAGKPTSLTATVNGNSPTGTMSFYDGNTLLGTATLSGGTATITATVATTGTHTITLVYSGDANNAATTATMTLLVSLPPERLMPIFELLLED